jgi:hypothetical protein
MTVIEIHSTSTTVTAVVGIVVAGVVGPAIAIVASKWADRRRFDHERKLKASDDFVARIDEVAGSLDDLCETCAIMRMTASVWGPETKEALEALSKAEQAHIRTRTLAARLKLRPHADSALVQSALAAAASVHAAIENVRNANPTRQAAAKAAGQTIVVGEYDDEIVESHATDALEHIESFESQARSAIGKLLS